MSFYPQITDSTLSQFQIVFMRMLSDPSFLDKPECPYNDSVKEFFKKYVSVEGSGGGTSIFDETGDKAEIIERQIGILIKDLDQMASLFKQSDSSERLQYLKTKAGLIEKLVSLQERLFNIKEMSEFQAVVMTFLEDICDKDQISTLMKRLGHVPSIGKPDDIR